jgi:tetratricopeptide (TPR) repeat protein
MTRPQQGAALVRRGRVATFYSYKGGTGRTQLLANVALVLASNERRVAVIDWDLEAPGLHRYFKPFLTDPDLIDSTGLIDMVAEYWDRLVELNAVDEPIQDRWVDGCLDFYKHAVTLNLTGELGRGSIVLIPAGRQNAAYSSKVSNFDWDAFYSAAGGRGFVEALADRLRAEFDHVLIDSRTGVADTAGICTIHLPDDLCLCFTYNNQNLLGTLEVARRATEERAGAMGAGRAGKELGRHRAPLRTLPIPTRAEYALQTYLGPRRALARRLFGWALPQEEQRDAAQYWAEVEQPYLPLHSYFETLACLTDSPGDPPPTLLLAAQNVARRLSAGEVQRWIPIFSDERRAELAASMEGAARQRPTSALSSLESPARDAWAGVRIGEVVGVLLRMVDFSADEALRFRSVPAGLVTHLGGAVDELLDRGLLLQHTGRRGAGATLELSTFAISLDGPFSDEAKVPRRLNARLLEVERMAERWRAGRGRDEAALPSAVWLAEAHGELLALREMQSLTAAEELYLVTAERQVERALARRKKLRGRVAVGLAVLGAAAWAWQSSESERRLAVQRAETAAERARADEQRARADEQRARADELRERTKALEFSSSLGKGHEAISRGDYEAAIEFFTQAERSSSQPVPDLYRARAESFLRLSFTSTGEAKREWVLRAAGDFVRWVELSPSASRHLHVADNLLRHGQVRSAVEQVNKAVLLLPGGRSQAVTEKGLQLVRTLQRQGAVSHKLASEWEHAFRGPYVQQ